MQQADKMSSYTSSKYDLTETAKNPGLNIEFIRDYLCSDKNAASVNMSGVVIGIQGDGPWGVIEFQKFLNQSYLKFLQFSFVLK